MNVPTPWRTALASRKFRIETREGLPAEVLALVSTETLMEGLYALARAHYPDAPGLCQDEVFRLLSATREGDGWRVLAEYSFDFDFASAVPNNVEHRVELELDPTSISRSTWGPPREP